MTGQGAKEAHGRNTFSLGFGAILDLGMELWWGVPWKQSLGTVKFISEQGKGVFRAERDIHARPGCGVRA